MTVNLELVAVLFVEIECWSSYVSLSINKVTIQLNPTQSNSTKLNPTQPNSTQLNPTQSNSTQLNPIQSNSIQLNPTQPNSIQLNPTQSNSIQLNPTQYNSTQLNPTQSNSIQLNPTQYNSIQLNLTQPNSIQLNPTQPNSIQLNQTQSNSIQLLYLCSRLLWVVLLHLIVDWKHKAITHPHCLAHPPIHSYPRWLRTWILFMLSFVLLQYFEQRSNQTLSRNKDLLRHKSSSYRTLVSKFNVFWTIWRRKYTTKPCPEIRINYYNKGHHLGRQFQRHPEDIVRLQSRLTVILITNASIPKAWRKWQFIDWLCWGFITTQFPTVIFYITANEPWPLFGISPLALLVSCF